MTSQPMYKYPSMNSVHSMVGMGHLPPGHGYIPSREKPDKPYGPSYVTVMNRMWRGPGRKYINYAIVCLSIAILFYVGGAVYFGHRNVGRMKVLNTEVFGAIMIMIAISFTAAFFQLIYKANVESNRWRGDVRFRAEGLCTAAAYNQAYLPDDNEVLKSGTYGPMAIKEIPRSARPVKSRGRSAMLRSGAQTPARSGLQTPVRSGLQTPAYRGYDEADNVSRGQSARVPNTDQPFEPQRAQAYGEKKPIRAVGAYESEKIPVRAQEAAGYYDPYPNQKFQPRYAHEKEREALGRASASSSAECPSQHYGPTMSIPLGATDDPVSLNRPAQVSTPQPSFYYQQQQQQQHQENEQQQLPEEPPVYLPPVRRQPVLPPVHRQPVTSSKKSQNDAFIG